MSELATQNDRVLAHLREHGTISQGVTLDWSPPITRLAARIEDLQEAGHPIENVGKDGKFALYRLGVSPVKPGGTPAQAGPVCPKCGIGLVNVRPSLSPSIRYGYCPIHKSQPVRVAA